MPNYTFIRPTPWFEVFSAMKWTVIDVKGDLFMNTTATTTLGFTTDNILQIVTILFTVIGGFFALCQWKKANQYNRSEYVGKVITKLRDDEDISFVMELIDWDDGFYYDSKFHFSDQMKDHYVAIQEDQLFQKIDKTLSHFSYVCYLLKNEILTVKDMAFYEYALRRLVDNPHICNYLYSIYHWSTYLQVPCSFTYLIEYALKKHYLTESFRSRETKDYILYLDIPEVNSGC